MNLQEKWCIISWIKKTTMADKYLEFVKKENPDSVVIINPNGGYLRYILKRLKISS